MRLRNLLEKAPFRVLIPFVFVLYFVSVILMLLLWPLVLLYGFLILCPLVWFKWSRHGKDVLMVSADTKDAREWSTRILSVVGERAVLLDYGERNLWPRWSIATQVFGIFGPHPIPESFMRYALPAVIVVKRNRKPKRFGFGSRKKDRDGVLDELRSELSR
jgi:hypothetical protein